MIERDHEVVFEDGANREIDQIREEYYDNWQKSFSSFYYNRNTGMGGINNNSNSNSNTRTTTSTGGGMSGGGMTGGGMTGGAYSGWSSNYYYNTVKPFEGFMKSKWTQLILGEIPVQPWLASYRRMYRSLTVADEVTSYQIERWCTDIINGYLLDPVYLICLGIVRGSSAEIKTPVKWGNSTNSNFFWRNMSHKTDPLIIQFSNQCFWDGSVDLVQILDKEDHVLLCRAIRSIADEEYRNSSYAWLTLAPFCGVLTGLSGAYHSPMYKLLPSYTMQWDSEKRFRSVMNNIINDGTILCTPPDLKEQYPMLRQLVSSAPSWSCVISVLYSNETIQAVPESFTVFAEEVQSKSKYYDWPDTVRELSNDIDHLIKVLAILPINYIFEITILTLNNSTFSSKRPVLSKPLFTFTTNMLHRLGNEQDETPVDLLAKLGNTIQSWLTKVFKSSKVRSLKHILKAFNEFLTQKELASHFENFQRALRTLLKLHDDRNILIKFLPSLKESEFTPIVIEKYEERAKEAVASFISSESLQNELLYVLERISGDQLSLKYVILQSFIENLCNFKPPARETILKWNSTWYKLFATFSTKHLSLDKRPNSDKLIPIWLLLNDAKKLLFEVNERAKDGSCSISELQDVLNACGFDYTIRLPSRLDHTPFYQLLSICKIQPLDRSVVIQRAEELIVFETRITQLQSFINLYCSHLRVACGTLPNELIELRRKWDDLIMKDVKDSFIEIPILPLLQQLYDRRASELYLSQWKRTSTRAFTKAKQDQKPVEKDEKGNIIVQEGEIPPPPPLPGNQEVKEEGEEDFLALGFGLFDEDVLELSIKENHEWNFQEIATILIPAVEEDWVKFYESVDSCTIKFPELTSRFSKLDIKQIQREMEVLSMLTHPSQRQKWQRKHFELLKNYKLLEGHRKRISNMLMILKHLTTLFSIDLVQIDPLYKSLKNCDETFAQQWDEQTLDNTTIFIDPVNQIFDGFSENHLLYLDEFCSSPELIQWFLEHNDTDAFNRLIGICKQNTDDPIALGAIACLLSTRNLLSKVLYPTELFNTLQEFLNSLKSAEITDDTIIQIHTANEQFAFLLKIFAEKTCSPGMQACFTLKEVMNSGKFQWVSSTTSSSSKSSSNNGDNMKTKLQLLYTTSVNTTVILSVDELLDLRNRLMLAEVPEQLEGLDIPSLVANYIDQLKIILEINSFVEKLYQAGHLSFQNFNAEFSCSTELVVLENKANELKQLLSQWKDIVYAAREKYYFLNFYSMTHMINLLALLDSLNEDTPMNEEGVKKESELNLSTGLDNKHVIDRIHQQLLYISTDVLLESIIEPILSWKISSQLKPEERLHLLGEFLTGIFQDRKPVSRIFTTETVAGGSRYVFDEGSKKAFIAITPPEKVLDLIVTLYVQHGRLPEPDEVLFCDSNTTIEDIELLLIRWSKASLYNRSDRLYCIANTDALSYTMQSKTARLLLNFKLTNCSSLVFISGKAEGQHLVSTLSHSKLEVGTLDDNKLKELHSKIASTFSYVTRVFASESAGGGKTTSIFKYVAETNLPYYQIPITGTIKADELITLFESTSIKSGDQTRLFHIDIGPTANDTQLNALLFQLLVIGILYDHTTGRLYSRAKSDGFLIEVANSFKNQIQNTLYFCKILPQETIEVSSKYYDLMDNEIFTNTIAGSSFFTFRRVPNYERQFVCKFLKAFKEGRFINFEADDEDFHPDMEEPLEANVCFDLLVEHISQEHKPSFLLLQNFSNFLYRQFVKVTMFPLLSNVAVAGALQRPDFKNFVIQFIIQTSHDFATRSISAKISDSDDIIEYAEVFQQMRRWDESDHPYVFFNESNSLRSSVTPAGLGILSLNPRLTTEVMNHELRETLKINGFDLDTDWTSISKNDAIELLAAVLGVEDMDDIDPTYVLTMDNIMKILSMQLRVRFGIPVLIMGATGCGKTALISFMCKFTRAPLFVLDVHGGIEDKEIIDFMSNPIAIAETAPANHVYVFFDEINTSASLSLFKNIVCDGFLNGKKLPDNIKFIAACNPYIIIKDKPKEIAGLSATDLGAGGGVGGGTDDPLSSLVYRVHPLPNTMLELCYDFGTLDSSTERLYIDAMLTKELKIKQEKKPPSLFEQFGNRIIGAQNAKQWKDPFIKLMTDLIAESHEFIRVREKGTCSLRDVARCLKLFNWFKETLTLRGTFNTPQEILKQSAILSLAICYHSRLSLLRKEYTDKIMQVYNKSNRNPNSNLKPDEFNYIIRKEEEFWVSQMNPGEGIALNEALCENIFMILVCILNTIPIFVVGKPGSSKSLAIELIGTNLNGQTSSSKFFQNFPAVEVFSYQCSPLSNSQGIEQTFHQALQYQNSTSNTRVVVLLDEVGLAEQSPHLPLKVLHKLLERPKLAVVGISNWALDLAKMNRAIHLTRPEPRVDDLKHTAMGIVSSQHLESSLQSLAQAYYNVYHGQRKKDFYGLRDFYHLIKYLHRNLEDTLTPQLLHDAICRNFGGHPAQLSFILKEFFSLVGMSYKASVSIDVSNLDSFPVIRNIKSNLIDKHARHLMLLTRNNAALQILFNHQILSYSKTIVLFGSDFSSDQSDLHICLNLQQIKTCMADGRTVVLVHQENLYESLYDMLNQHYTQYGGQRFVRLAMGTNSRLCPVHNDFRVIVIVDAEQAYHQLAPPLLNRFEKQVLMKQDLLDDTLLQILDKLSRWVSEFSQGMNDLGKVYRPGDVFVGFNDDLLPSLVLKLTPLVRSAIQSKYNTEEGGGSSLPEEEYRSIFFNTVINESINRLLWLATPEAVVRARNNKQSAINYEEMYFNEQVHSSLTDFLEYIIPGLSSSEARSNIDNENNPQGSGDENRGKKKNVCKLCEDGNEIRHRFLFGNDIIESCNECFIKFKESNENAEQMMKDHVDLLNEQVKSDENIKKIENKDIQLLKEEEKQKELTSTSVDSTDSTSSVSSNENNTTTSVREGNSGTKLKSKLTIEESRELMTIITYSPLASVELESMIESKYPTIKCESLKLHEFTSARELTARVQSFYEDIEEEIEVVNEEEEEKKKEEKKEEEREVKGGRGKGKRSRRIEYSMLMIQCDPAASSLKRIAHARYIMEKEQTNYLMKKEKEGSGSGSGSGGGKRGGGGGVVNKYGILMIHLNRESNALYSVDFESSWTFYMIDDIKCNDEGDTGIPTIQTLLYGSEIELLQKISLKPTLLMNFRSCLARLIYPFTRTSKDIQEQIEMILKLLNDLEFMQPLEKLIFQLIDIASSNHLAKGGNASSSSWQEDLSNRPNEISQAGSFREALFRRLSDTVNNVFTQILCYIDRNSNLSLYGKYLLASSPFQSQSQSQGGGGVPSIIIEENELNRKKLWLRMFKDENICSLNVVSNNSDRYDVISTGNGNTFQSKFPFSFIFCNTIESIRYEAEKLPGELVDSVKRIVKSTFPTILEFSLNEYDLENYLYDFICQKGYVSKIQVNTQYKIYKSIFKKYTGSSLQSIIHIHTAFWKYEKILQQIFILLDFLPSIEEKFIHELAQFDVNPNLSVNQFAIKQIELSLDSNEVLPSEFIWENKKQQLLWMQLVDSIKSSIIYILENASAAGMTVVDPTSQENQQSEDKNTKAAPASSTTLTHYELNLYKKWECLLFIKSFIREVAFTLLLDKSSCLEFSNLILTQSSNFRNRKLFESMIEFLIKVDGMKKNIDEKIRANSISLLIELYFSELLFSKTTSNRKEELLPMIEVVTDIICENNKLFNYHVDNQPKSKFEQLRQQAAAGGANKNLSKSNIHISNSLRTYLLHNMLSVDDQFPLDHSIRNEFIQVLSKKYFGSFKHDSSTAILFTQSVEDLLWQKVISMEQKEEKYKVAIKEIQTITSHSIFVSKKPQELFKKLIAIGVARFFLINLAEIITECMMGERMIIEEDVLNEYIKQSNSILHQGNSSSNLQVFLLKQLSKSSGIPFVQQFLTNENMIKTFPWITVFINQPNGKLFLRKKHLFNSDPYQLMNGYKEMRNAIRAAIDGNTKSLVDIMQKKVQGSAGQQPGGQQQHVFILAVYQEVYVTHTLDKQPKEILQFIKFIQSNDKWFHPFVFNFINSLLMNELPSSDSNSSFPGIFTLTPNSASTQILLMSIITHLFAVISKYKKGQEENIIIQFFANLLHEPEKLTSWYLPSMPEDRRGALMAVLGGGWYECPNGHTYYVDACGRPTEELTCHTCGEKIGGLDHNLIETNKLSDKSDRSSPGYCVQVGDDSLLNINASERLLPPVAFRMLRLFIHSILLLRSVYIPSPNANQSNSDSKLMELMKHSEIKSNVNEYLYKQVVNDWELLVKFINITEEDINIMVHHVIHAIDSKGSRIKNQTLLSNDGRKEWEGEFTQQVITSLLLENNIQRTLRRYYSSFEHDTTLVSELRESIDIGKLNQDKKEELLPILWRYRISLSLNHLRRQFNTRNEHKDEFPVLHLFLTEEEKLRSLQFLRVCLEWQNQLSIRFDRRIDRDYARNTAIQQILSELSNEDKNNWSRLWNGYKECWNSSWKYVDRFLCTEIPDIFRSIVMNDDSPLVFSLPDEKDEGICPLSFINYMTDKHNQFLEQVHRVLHKRSLGDEIMEEIGGIENEFHVPTNLLTDNHLISYSVEKELVPFLHIQSEQSLQYGCGSDITYNWSRIEKHIIDRVLSGKPFIDLTLRKFTFANETRMSGALSNLKSRIPQSELTTDDKSKIIKELGTLQNIKKLKNIVEICIGFLSATSTQVQSIDGEIMVQDYVKNTLLLQDSFVLTSGSTAAKVVRLSNIVSLWNLLEDKLIVDPFEPILSKYKQPLTPAISDELLHHFRNLQAFEIAELLPIWKETILNYLTEGHMGVNFPIRDILSLCTDSTGDTLDSKYWFNHNFPPTVPMMYCVEAYKFFESLSQKQ